MTFFFRVFFLFLMSSMFIGRIGADMILRLDWNCARRAVTDNRPLAPAEASELFGALEEAVGAEIADVLPLGCENSVLYNLKPFFVMQP